jgi:hypothetical protein
MAPPAERAQKPFPFTGTILDSLPPDVRAVTDEDVKKVQEEARALVRAQALSRTRSFAYSARHISDIIRFNRVEGLALGSGFLQRIGGGLAVAAAGRYGFSDEEFKGRGAVEYRTGAGSSLIFAAERLYRDVSDEQETSLVRNTIAAQEFGSDYTDPIDVMGGAVKLRWHKSDLLAFGAAASVERQRALAVNASPITGRYGRTLAADPLNAIRFSLTAERPLSIWSGKTQIGGKAELRVQQSEWRDSAFRNSTTRLFVTTEWVRPLKLGTLRSWNAFASVGPDSVPAQEMVYFGGPVSAPGFPYHALRGKWGYAHRLEWKIPVPFPRIPLGRFGATPARATFVPYGSLAAINVGLCAPAGVTPVACGTWIRPSVGVGLFTFYDVVRFDVAMGLAKQGRFMFGFDVAKQFWSIL